jgi:hypothetical protein
MGLLSVGTVESYKAALQRLLPRGEFWERQLSDNSSDVSLWLAARAEELRRSKLRLSVLVDEAVVDTASETIDDWERVADVDNHTLALSVRKSKLLESKITQVNITILKQTAALYGAEISDVSHPYSPAIFGHTRFASRLATPAAWNVLYITMTIEDLSLKSSLESSLTGILLASHIPYFFYEEG